MTVFGYDISHHQGGFDHDQAYEQGMRFMYAKVSEGEGFRDALWPANRDAAREVGLYIAGYHFLRSDSSVEAQADNVAEWLGGDIPIVIDCEPYPDRSTRPTLRTVRQFILACADRDVSCTLLYLPRWYWQELGSPDLAGLPPLIQSNYGANLPGDPTKVPPAGIYPGDDSTRWDYDIYTPTILQFGSKGQVAGQRVDVNAFRGHLDDLAQWFLPPQETPMDPKDVLNAVLNPWRPKAEQITLRRGILRLLNQQEVLDDKLDAAIQKFEAGDLTADEVADELAERLQS